MADRQADEGAAADGFKGEYRGEIFLATLTLAEQAFVIDAGIVTKLTMALVAILTLLSIAFYLAGGSAIRNSFGAGH